MTSLKPRLARNGPTCGIVRPIGTHIDPDERSVRRQHVLILRVYGRVV